MRVELIVDQTCPDAQTLGERLREAVLRLGLPMFVETAKGALDTDDPRRGFQSPTILVEGHDLFGAQPREPEIAEQRRTYAGGLPDTETLIERLRAEKERIRRMLDDFR